MPNNYAPVKCSWCGGSGKWNVSPGNSASCVVCFGKGQVSAAEPAKHCRECRGSGKRNAVSPCLTCAGTGWENVLGQ
jgi:DnaJ-class molecular chaperone